MVIEIEEHDVENNNDNETEKLVVICRMCNRNFTPEAYTCPYIYHPEMGLHIPLCDICRAVLKSEQQDSEEYWL